MADDLVEAQAGASAPVDLQLEDSLFEGVLTALSAGRSVDGEIAQLQSAVYDAIIAAGGDAASAEHAAEAFVTAFRTELFDGNLPMVEAAEYAQQAMSYALANFDPSTLEVDPAAALLAAIASGQGVEEAVADVVAQMLEDGDLPVDPAEVEAVFLEELQNALARGESPEQALAEANGAAQSSAAAAAEIEVPVDNPILAALAGGENVGDALDDAVDAAGGDADAFVDGLEASLADGVDMDSAMADATEAAADSEAAKEGAKVELSAADKLAQALATGEEVADALGESGGGDAFASTLEDALANGTGAGDALAQADDAQAQQEAQSAAQSVPLSAADQLAASLASGENVEEALGQNGGDSAFADTLQDSLAQGLSPDSALESGQQASAAAADAQQQQSVPISPADQLAASLASGENVADAIDQAGGGEAFGDELANSLANGETPAESLAQAASAQESADSTAEQQSVPADPAATALAQGGDAAGDVDLAEAVAQATGTTGGETGGGEPAATEPAPVETAAAEPEPQPAAEPQAQPAAAEPQPAASEPEPQQVAAAPQSQPAEQASEPQAGPQGEPQTETETAKSTEEVAAAPEQNVSNEGATGESDATGGGVTETIQTASNDEPPATTTDPGVGDGGGSDGPTDEEIEALQDIASAAGGNTGGTGTGTSGGSSFEDAQNATNIGGSNSTLGSGFSGPSTPTGPTGPTGGTGGTRPSSNNNDSGTVTGGAGNDPVIVNLAPIANADAAAGTENQSLTLSVLANDSDPEGVALTITGATVPAGQGTVTNNGTSLLFEPGTDFDSLDAGDTQDVTISYTVSDGAGGTASSTATVTVTGTNDAPTIELADSDVTGGVTEFNDNTNVKSADLTTSGDVTFEDLDADGSHTVATPVAVGAALGSMTAVITDTADGGTGTVEWTYSANEAVFDALAEGETATETFRITVRDDQGAEVSQDVKITITGTNDSPIAQADTAGTTENTSILIDVLANDADVDNAADDLTLTDVSVPDGQGSVSIENGQIRFDPGTDFDSLAAGAEKTVAIRYQISDGAGGKATSIASVTITGTNDAPTVTGPVSGGTFAEDAASITMNLLAGASDVDDGDDIDTSSVQVTSSDGRVVGFSINNETGELTVNSGQFNDLAEGQEIALTVSYNVVDGNGGVTPNTASATITGTNDGPVAVADSAGTTENTSILIDVLANDTDVDNAADDLTLTNVSVTEGEGSVSIENGQIRFNPGTDFDSLAVGDEQVVTISYTISDGAGGTASSTADVTITGTNDAPTVTGPVSGGTFAEDAASITFNLLEGAADVDDGDDIDTSSVQVTSSDGRAVGFSINNETGELTVNSGQFNDLAEGQEIALTVSYNVVDGNGGVTPNTASATITGTNDGPVAVADSLSGGDNNVVEGTGNNSFETALSLDGHFAISDNPNVADSATLPHVSISGVGNNAQDFFQFTVVEPNTTLHFDIDGAANIGNSFDAWLNLWNFDGSQITSSDDSALDPGSTSGLDSEFSHTFATPGVYAISVAQYPNQPIPEGGDYTLQITTTSLAMATGGGIDENETVTIDVLANDTDADAADNPATFTLDAVAAPDGQGTASIVDNQLVFNPGTDFDHLTEGDTETVTLTYTMSDAAGAQSSSTVEIQVTGTNDAPTVTGPVAVAGTSQNAGVLSVDLLAGASDADDGSDIDTASVIVTSEDGRVVAFSVDNETGAFTLDPAQFADLGEGQSVGLSVSFNVVDGVGGVTPNTANFSVTGSNDAPEIAINGALPEADAVGDEDTAISLDALSVLDIDGDAVTVTLSAADGGVLSVTGVNDDIVAGNGTSEMTLTGTSDIVNAAIQSLTFTGAANFNGTTSVAVSITDGDQTVNDTLTVQVNPVADAPIVLALNTPTLIAPVEDFSAGADGWSNAKTVSAAGYSPMLGNFAVGDVTEKTFTVPADTGAMTISFDFHRIDSWDNESFRVLINGETIVSKAFSHSGTAGDSVFTATTGGSSNLGFASNFTDQSYTANITLTAEQVAALPDDGNGGKSLTLGFTSSLDQAANDESWGIDNLALLAHSPDAQIDTAQPELTADLLAGTTDVEGNGLSVANVQVTASDGRDVGFSVDADTGALSVDMGQFADLDTGNQAVVLGITYDVVSGSVSTPTVASFVVQGVNDAPVITGITALDGVANFDGIDDDMRIAHSDELNFHGNTPVTVEMWINPDDVSGLTTLFDKSVSGTDDITAVRFHIADGKISVYNNVRGVVETSEAVVSAGEWSHVAFAFDGTSLSILVNGVAQALNSGGTSVNYALGAENDGEIRVGDDNQATRNFDGQISDLRIWDVGRTAGEIQATMNDAVSDPANTDGLVGYYTFNSATDGQILDLTGSGNNLSFVGGPTLTTASDSSLASVSIDQVLETGMDQQITGQILTFDDESEAITVAKEADPENGALLVAADGSYTYAPNAGYTGNDSFQVRLTDASGNVRVETIIVSVDNSAPTLDPNASAFNFDGATHIVIGDDPALDVTNTFTIEMWVKPQGEGTLFSKDGVGPDTTGAYNLALIDPGDGSGLTLSYETNNTGSEISIGNAVSVGEWHHLAASYDNGIMTLYVDGQEVHRAETNEPSVLDTDLVLGRRGFDGDPDFYSGEMNDVRLWDVARSGDDILADMSSELTGTESGLVGYWTFNEADGGTVFDNTGNGNDGTVAGTVDRSNLVEVTISNSEVYKGLLLGGDSNGDHLTYAVADGPDHGTVTFDGAQFTYEHAGDGHSDSFTVQISDGTETITEQIDVNLG